MKYKLFIILYLLCFSYLYAHSQEPVDGLYKLDRGIFDSGLLYKNNGRFHYDNKFSGTIKFSDKNLILEYPTRFKLESYILKDKKNVSDSLIIRFIDPEYGTKNQVLIDEIDSLILVENGAISIANKYLLANENTLTITVHSATYKLDEQFKIPKGASELNIYIKGWSDYKKSQYTWRYGDSKNEVIVDEKFRAFYLNSSSLEIVTKNVPAKGFKKIKPETINETKRAAMADDELFLTEMLASSPSDDELIEDSIEVIVIDTLAVEAMVDSTVVVNVEEESVYPAYYESVGRYIKKVNSEQTVSGNEPARSLEDLKKLAKENNKYIRIYYNTPLLDIKYGLGESSDYTDYIDSYYIIQQYDKKEFKKIKELGVSTVPQILILNPYGEILYTELNPIKVTTSEEQKTTLTAFYKKLLKQENEKLRKKSDVPNPRMEDIIACLTNTNTILALDTESLFSLNLLGSQQNPKDEKDALIYSFDCVANLPESDTIISFVKDYFSLNREFSLRDDKLPAAMAYLLKYLKTDKKSAEYAESFFNNALSPNGITSILATDAMIKVPEKKDHILNAYLYNNLYQTTVDSIDVIADFLKVHYTEVQPDSINGSPMFAKNYPIYLNSVVWKLFLNNESLYYPIALIWIDKALSIDDNPAYIDTKSHILYRMGQKEEAIKLQQEAINKSKDKQEITKDMLFEMKLDLELMHLDIL